MSYVKRKSAKQEKRTSEDIEGSTVVASGALWGAKGDARSESYLVENKFTDEDCYIFKLAIWKKIEMEAVKDGMRIPLMQIDIQDKQYYVMNMWDFDELSKEFTTTPTTSILTSKSSFKMKKEEFSLDYLEYGVVKFLDGGVTLAVMRREDFLIMYKDIS